MNICFFNLTEIRDGKTLNGVDRVASVLAAILRSRGARVDFYTPPNSRFCNGCVAFPRRIFGGF